jgi:hypothetical protein
MISGKLLRSLLCGALCGIARSADVEDVKIGDHPASRITPYPAILTLHVHNGRVYMGYGASDDYYPAVYIASYDPAGHRFRIEHAAMSDRIEALRSIGGTLYVPHIDPVHFEDFRDYSYLGPDGIWRDAAPGGYFHAHDIAGAGGELFLCGSKDAVEGQTGTGIIMKSSPGAAWSLARTGFGDRFYWCAGLGSRLYFQNGFLEAGGFTSSGSTPPLPGNSSTRSLTVSGQQALFTNSSGALLSFDGVALTTLDPSSWRYAQDGEQFYALRTDPLLQRTRVYRAAWLTTSGVVWEPTPVLPTGASAFAVLNGRAYFGGSDGSLRAANLDGTPLTLPVATVQNLLPDSFGRGLAASGLLLACGAPDATSTQTAAGNTQIWQETAGTPRWTLSGQISPPAPRLSGWFGKDVALERDLLAVVETGYDTTGRDRGSSARVHTYQYFSGSWASRTVFSTPYAHSVAMLPDFLAVAAANVSGQQAAGHPGITPYRITRSFAGAPTFTAQTQLRPVLNKWGYKPSCRVVMQGDMLVGGFAGDPSRLGGQGMVSVWRRAAGGTTFTAAPEQEFPGPGPDRFGFALALDGLWLAVGAPRDDESGPQAGAVHLYRRASLSAPFTPAQKLLPPGNAHESAFGSALVLRGSTLLIGAPGTAADGVMHRGATYIFRRGEDDVWTLTGEMPRPAASLAEFGVEVAMSDTLLIAASRLSDNSAPAMERLSFLPHPEPATLYDTWLAEHLLTHSEDRDSDGDGVTDLVEYASNLDPRAPDAAASDHAPPVPVAGLPQVGSTGTPGQFAVTWLQRRDDPRLSTTLEYSSNLADWHPASAASTSTVFQDDVWTLYRSEISLATDVRTYVRVHVQLLRP